MSAIGSGAAASPPASPVRWFGRRQLLRLLGKSDRSMCWLVIEPRSGQELMLVLPRVQPAGAEGLERWQQAVRKASRLNHPNLAAVIEVGVQDGWPFAAYDPLGEATLADHITKEGLAGAEVAALGLQLMQGLAFAHDAGAAHHDIQPFLALVGEGGGLRLVGLGVASEAAASEPLSGLVAAEPGARREQRDAAQRDVLAAGVLLHMMITGQGAIEERDVARVVLRLPPLGREIVRLPWTTARPVAEPLRAIVNRATDRQERQRYHSARTLASALEGWLQTETGGAGALALLAERLRNAGVLPATAGGARRVARLVAMERERTNELAEVVLEDLALSFEMLRLVNSAQVRGAQVSGSGPVLTVRRAIAMLGLEGVRRAATALRDWPGPLSDVGAADLQRQLDRVKRAGRLALALRPAGYDSEVVYLVTLLQNLGRLVVHYHFPDEAQQIHRLMLPAPATREGEAEEPGMSEQGAAYAVLGIDIESLGSAVARHWGLDDAVLALIRRLPPTTPVHTPESDDETLRLVASCANETMDAMSLAPHRVATAMQRVAQRYGRALEIGLRDLQAALAGKPPDHIAPTEQAPLDEAPQAPAPVAALRRPAGSPP
ncbi:HDOD domain-containing protein [Rubrivivax sp. A210]|uniref:HDOD domain-containing protein n=1 Tax=Rubrivivax sp. A210 TaxID=2772301 RepID=UPI0019AA3912|nr:HDOD domain-containing protein [Rubrivivax sp. A210]CAD5373959.1 HDOD domain-containing protein [Rubrivivax sp. A210]